MKRNIDNYGKGGALSDFQVLERAAEIIKRKHLAGDVFDSPEATKVFLTYKLVGLDTEVFSALLLNSQHQLLAYKELFHGTIDSASIYPREVVKVVLEANAAAVIFAHNHPSGNSEPSDADIKITSRLKAALALIDVRVLDHIVIGESATSLAERGLL